MLDKKYLKEFNFMQIIRMKNNYLNPQFFTKI